MAEIPLSEDLARWRSERPDEYTLLIALINFGFDLG